MALLNRIAAFLDRELRVASFPDVAHNGLQVANEGHVRRICCGVDANLEFFETARQRGADLLICHHGISWGDSLARITEAQYRRVAFLIRHNLALYAAHLPLDAHPRLGNNARIARALGLRQTKPFGLYHGIEIGRAGRLARPVAYEVFKRRVERVVGRKLRTMDFGPPTVRSVAVVSGAAPDLAEEAGRKGLDVLLTGEPSLQARTPAMEYGLNILFAGHYATEIFGVRALAGLLARRFRLPCDVIDFRVPF